MTKQFRNIFLALIVILNFSSCSYRYFYSQRIDVYAFDSAGQTKGVVEPSFDLFGLHLGVARSFSDHIFFEANSQFATSVFKLYPWDYNFNPRHNLIGWTGEYSIESGCGYYKSIDSKKIFQVKPSFQYERCKVNTGQYRLYDDSNNEGYFDGNKINYNYYVPSVQSSVCFKGKKKNWYFVGRISYLISDSISKRFTPDYAIFEKVFYNKNIIFEPGIQFSDARSAKSKRVRFYLSGHICLKKTNDFSFTAPVQCGIKFMF